MLIFLNHKKQEVGEEVEVAEINLNLRKSMITKIKKVTGIKYKTIQ